MPWNGSGQWVAPSSPGAFKPAITGSTATPATWNALLSDIESGLSNAICKDGQSTITQDIPFAAHKIVDLGDATNQTDALNQQGALYILDQQNITAQSLVDVTGIPATVNNLEIRCGFISSTNSVTIGLRTYGADGVLDTGASDYYWNIFTFNTLNATSVTSLTASSINLTTTAMDNGTAGFQCTIKANNIQQAAFTKFAFEADYQGGANGITTRGNGARSEADRITGWRIFVSSGTVTGRFTTLASV